MDIDFGIGAYYGLDQSPEFQQINFEKKIIIQIFFMMFTHLLTYTEIKRSVGAVDGEKGIKSSLNVSSSITEGNFFQD